MAGDRSTTGMAGDRSTTGKGGDRSTTGMAGDSGTTGMAGDSGTDRPRAGRPRSERARRAILRAAAELLLEHGLGAVSMDVVARSAEVSKATIYRWWPTKEALALDALYHEWNAMDGDPKDTGSLRGDLLALLRPWGRRVVRRPYARVIGAFIIEARSNPAFAEEYLARLVHPRRDAARSIFDRAVQRGELGPEVDVEIALDLLYGALYLRLLQGHAPLTDRFVRAVVDMALSGLSA